MITADNGGAITLEQAIPGHSARDVRPPPEWSILVVEALIVQKFVRVVLEREGYAPVDALPQSALEMLKQSPSAVGLVITNAPGMFLPFAEQVPLIYLAACPDLDLAARFRSCRVLQKPFHPAELLEAVRCLKLSS